MIFQGDRAAMERWLRVATSQFYVYLLSRPDGEPFYVGKGQNRRVLEHELEARRHHPLGESNPFKCNVIRKILREGGEVGYSIAGIFAADDEVGCLALEAELIARHKRLHEGGTLTNLAGGLGNLSGAAPFSLERHADTLAGEPACNAGRATLNRFLLGIGPVRSVPIKPVGQMSRILPTTPHPNSRQPTARCAYALVASAAACGLQLKPGVLIPRCFEYAGVSAIIENGVARDIVKARMADLVPAADPKLEQFTVSGPQLAVLIRLIGRPALAARGLV